MSGPLRSIIPVALILVVTVVVAVTVALLAAPDDTKVYPLDSPEGTVQGYIQAIQDRDIERAYDMLSSSVREDVSRGGFRRMTRVGVSSNQVSRIRLDRVETAGDRASVLVTVQRVSGTGIDVNRYSYQHTFPLVREDGAWKIDELVTTLASSTRVALTG